MPTSREVDSDVRARVLNRGGAGEPPGEPASPPGILGAMQNDLQGKLSDELVDELLADASSEEIVGPGHHSTRSRPSTGRSRSRLLGLGMGSFEPKIVRKRRRPFEGFDQKILALYSRGFFGPAQAGACAEIYGVEVSTGLISQVTDAVVDDARSRSGWGWTGHGACSGCGSRPTWVPGSDVGPDRAQAARRQRHRDLLRGRPQRVPPR
jgi:hypothetical protein